MSKSNLLFVGFIIFVIFCFWLLEQKSITSNFYVVILGGVGLIINGLFNLYKAIFKGYGDTTQHPFMGGANLFPETAIVKDSFRKNMLIFKAIFSLLCGLTLTLVPSYLIFMK